MIERRKPLMILGVLALSLLLAACGGEEPLPTADAHQDSHSRGDQHAGCHRDAPFRRPRRRPTQPCRRTRPYQHPKVRRLPTSTPAPVAFLTPTEDDVNTRKGPGTDYGKVGHGDAG